MGLIAMVNLEPDMEVVAEATHGNQACALFKRWKPDLTLLDVRMPVKNRKTAGRRSRGRRRRGDTTRDHSFGLTFDWGVE